MQRVPCLITHCMPEHVYREKSGGWSFTGLIGPSLWRTTPLSPQSQYTSKTALIKLTTKQNEKLSFYCIMRPPTQESIDCSGTVVDTMFVILCTHIQAQYKLLWRYDMLIQKLTLCAWAALVCQSLSFPVLSQKWPTFVLQAMREREKIRGTDTWVPIDTDKLSTGLPRLLPQILWKKRFCKRNQCLLYVCVYIHSNNIITT